MTIMFSEKIMRKLRRHIFLILLLFFSRTTQQMFYSSNYGYAQASSNYWLIDILTYVIC